MLNINLQTLKSPYDLVGRYEAAFGFLAKNVVSRLHLNEFGFSRYEDSDDDFEAVTLSYNGVSLVFSAFPFEGKGKTAFHIPFSKSIEPDYSGIVAPPPLITFSRAKKLITTSLNGSDHEVIERWNTRQWDIRMRGILIDMEHHHYPTSQIKVLHQLFDYNNVVEVSGTQFLEKDISSLYFKQAEIMGVEGYQDTVQYTLNARSTSEVNFTLLNP